MKKGVLDLAIRRERGVIVLKKYLFVLAIFVMMFPGLTGWVNPVQASTEYAGEGKKESKPVTIYLVRHGKTILNNTDRAQGWIDAPLIPSGEEKIKETGKRLAHIPFVGAYSSDSGRAIKTAKLILGENQTTAKSLPVLLNKNLREAYFGSFEGEKMNVLWKETAKYLGFSSREELFASNGNPYEKLVNALSELDPSKEAENYQMLKDRAFKAITEIAEKTYQKGGGDLLVVSHGITMNAILNQIDKNKVPKGLFANGTVMKLEFNGKDWKVAE